MLIHSPIFLSNKFIINFLQGIQGLAFAKRECTLLDFFFTRYRANYFKRILCLTLAHACLCECFV